VKRVGEWEVLGELARGGQGVVLRARHAVHGTPAAIKLLLRVELKTVLRFRQEAAVLLRLNHPNLVRVFEAEEHEARPFLAMELIEGQSLADLVREGGPPPFERTARLLAAVARAVHHCHAQGVVHRDLKPENVIVEEGTGRPVLVDFGLVKRDRELFGALSIDELTRLSRSGELRGTPVFMAPEQVDPGGEHGEVGPWSDVHGLGGLLHVLLTGEPPVEAESLPELLRAVASEPPADPRATNPAVPPALAALCLRARARARAERPGSAADFAAALEAAALEAAPRPRPSRAPWLVAGGLALLGGGGAAAVAFARPGERPVDVAPIASAIAPAEDPDALLERALTALATDPELARALAEQALARDPGRLRARGVRAMALLPRGDLGLVEATITADPTLQWAARPDGSPDLRLLDVWFYRGLRRFRDADLEGALADSSLLVRLRPDDPLGLLLRAQVELERGDARAARADLDLAVGKDPDLAMLWLVRGEARLRRGDPRGAIADVAAARARDPSEVDHLCTAARAHAALGEHAAAVESLGRVLAASSKDEVFVRTLRAAELCWLDRLPEALADLEAALRLAPRNARALSTRGLVRWRTGAREQAAADYAAADVAALELTPARQAEGLVERARLRHRAKDPAGALADVDRALALAPGWRPRSLRGAVLHELGRGQEALAELDAVVAADAGSPDVLSARAQVRQSLSDHAGAVEDLGRALALEGADVLALHLLRARSLSELGDLSGALADLDEAVAASPEGDVRALIDRVELRRQRGDGPGVVADSTRLIERMPANHGAWHGLGVGRLLVGDVAGAMKALDRAIELAGETASAGSSLQHRAACHRAAGDHEATLADLSHAVALRPDLWGAWHDLGLARSQLKDLQGAREAHTRAIELAPGKDRIAPLIARAALHRGAKDFALALADLDQAVALDPGRWDAWSARGWCRQVARVPAGELVDLVRAVALGPREAVTWRNRAWARRALRDWSGAEADMTRALTLAPREGELWSFRAGLRQRRLDAAGAVEDFSRALDLGHAVPSTLRQRATARRDLDDLEGAFADLALALEKEPRAADALVVRAQLLRDFRNDLDAALKDEDAAVAVDPASQSARRSRSLTRLERGDRAGAQADADEAVRLAPTSNEVYAGRARVRLALGDAPGARTDAETALALEPSSAYAHWALALVLLAEGDAAGAIAACDSSIAADARAPRALATRADALVALGRPAEALADLERAAAFEPARLETRLARAKLREATGDRPGAAADLREALALLGPGDPRRATASAALARLER